MQPIYTIAEDKLSNYCESSISISTDKKYFSVGSTKGEIYVFSLATGELVDKYDNKSSASITSISWRPYHSQMFVGDANGVVTVWTNS
jgi:WD40 repeat protein